MTDRFPAACALHHRRGERSRRAALPAAGDVARRQDRRRSRRRRAQDRAARRRSGAARATAPAARRKARCSSSSTPPSARWCSILQTRPAARTSRNCSTRRRLLFEEPASIAALARAGKATPIEIAAFPLEMNAARRPVSEFTLQALGGLLHMVGEPERKPLRLGGHQASYAAGLTAFTGLTAALAARDAGQHAPPVRVSLAEVLQWVNWKAASGRGRHRHLARPRGQESEFQIVPCRDGHVAVVYTATQWPATRALIGDPRPGRCQVQHARRTTPAHRRTLRDHHAVVRRQDACRDPEDGAGQGRAVRPDLLAGRAARDRAVRRARFPHRYDASRSSARSACRSFPCSGTAAPSRRGPPPAERAELAA